MSAEVVTLGKVAPSTDRRAFFINEFAAMFDRFVADYAEEPEAFVLVCGGVRQTLRVSWTTQGDTEGAAVAMLAMASAVITKEMINPDPN